MINRTSPIPMYLQVKVELENKIKSGELKAGDRIYSENELCQRYGVSRITAKKSLDELVKDGYLYRIQGRGSFVQGPRIDHKLSNFYSFTEEVKARGMVAGATVLNVEKIEPDQEIMDYLGIADTEMVYYIRRLRKADDAIIALDHSYIPCSVCGYISKEDLSNHSLYEILNNHGVVPDKAVESFYADSLCEEEARLLGESIGSAALKIRRLTYSQNQLIEYNYRYYKGNQYTYTVELDVK